MWPEYAKSYDFSTTGALEASLVLKIWGNPAKGYLPVADYTKDGRNTLDETTGLTAQEVKRLVWLGKNDQQRARDDYHIYLEPLQ